MIADLLGRLESRFIFVVGKGGVGKTTTAGALALALADSGRPTHLISTDPAHSLGDLFDEASPAAAIRPSPCSPRLVLEEFDAERYAEGWIRRAAGPIAELVEGGTYLDREDVRSFLDLSLPGVDEVMAALRLAELAQQGPARVVVDTAPTGHTLRLLDSGELLSGWMAAFRAMAEKAGVVASSLLRRTVRLPAEQTLDELEARLGRFETEVLAAATFVIVSRPGQVVRAETERLGNELKARRLRVGAEVRTGGPGDGGDALVVPERAGYRGCEGLRAWGRESGEAGEPGAAADAGEAAGAAEAGAGSPPDSSMAAAAGQGNNETSQDEAAGAQAVAVRGPAPADLFRRELLLFAGKGGVGKSTCAAACAVALAEHRSVSLFSTDPAGSLADVLGLGDLPPDGARLPSGLVVRQVDAVGDFQHFRRNYEEEVERVFARFGLDRSAALDRRVVESLWNLAPPGIDEIFGLVAILEAGAGRDTLIVDAAPTGHFLRLLEMPGVALEWTHALLRIFLKYRVVIGLDDTAESVLKFAKQLKALNLKLSDPARTGVFLVTLDEPIVRAETERLRAVLARASVPVAARILNRAPPGATAGAGGEGDPLVRAPWVGRPLVGEPALRAFFGDWELVS